MPLRTPPSEVPADIVALESADTVPRAVLLNDCINAIRIGSRHPPHKKRTKRIISAIMRFGENGKTQYRIALIMIVNNNILVSPIRFVIFMPKSEPIVFPNPITIIAVPTPLTDKPKVVVNQVPKNVYAVNVPVWKIK